MENLIRIDYQYLQSPSRLLTLFFVMTASNVVVFGFLGWLASDTFATALTYAVVGFLTVTIIGPLVKALPQWIGYELHLKAQLRLFFFKILADSSFPKDIPFSGDGDKWLTELKLNNELNPEQRIKAAELLLIIQSIASANSDLPKANEKVLSVFSDSVSDYMRC